MAIAFVAATTTAVANNEGTTADITWVGTGTATRLALLWAVLEPSTTAFNANPTGFTPIGELAGTDPLHSEGTADAHPTRLGVWYKVMDGTETGVFTFTSSPIPASIQCVMTVYSTTLGGWATPIFVSGVDNAHGTNRSAICGAWGSALAANDLVAWGSAIDTDTALTITAPGITQTGATFGTTNQRTRWGSSTGADVGVTAFDTPVTTGTANAPTLAWTSATQQCGPNIAVRLREQAAGGVPQVPLIVARHHQGRP